VIIESSMLVLGDDEKRLIPEGTFSEGFLHVFHHSFAFQHRCDRVLPVREALGGFICFVRVGRHAWFQKGVVREIACSYVNVKLFHVEHLLKTLLRLQILELHREHAHAIFVLESPVPPVFLQQALQCLLVEFPVEGVLPCVNDTLGSA